MDSRFKKLKWNSILALCYQFILIITGLILPRCFLHYYGSEVNGLISSITQFLAFINICDLGISAVVSAAYYKPLADGDTYAISKIFVYSKRFFRIIGFVLLAYVAILLGVYPTLINTTFDFWFTFALIAAMSLSQLGQYFIGISYQLLLNSDQKSYVQLIVNGSTLLVNTIVSVLLMVSGANIQLVKLTTSIIYLLRPLAMYLYVKKNYIIDKSVPIDKSAIPQKRNGIVQHIAYMVYSNTDVMVLTFYSLKDVSIYSVYTLVANSIKQIITAATTGVQALFGNMIARNETDKLKSLYSLYNWGIHTICTILFTVTGLMIVPFVKIYTSGIPDAANYNLPVFALLITIAYFFDSLRNCQYVLIRAAGHFKQTQTASLIECFLNLSISIALVFFFGLTGVAIGTIIATVFFVIYETVYFNKHIVFIPIRHFLKQFLVDILIVAATVIISLQINLFAGSIGSWILQAMVVTLISIAISIIGQLVFYKGNLNAIFKKVLQRIKK